MADGKDCTPEKIKEYSETAKTGKSLGDRVEERAGGGLLSLFLPDTVVELLGSGITAKNASPQFQAMTHLKECKEREEKESKEGKKVGQAESSEQKPAEKSFLSGIFDKMDPSNPIVKLPSSQDKDGGILSNSLRPNTAASGELLPKPAPTPPVDTGATASAVGAVR